MKAVQGWSLTHPDMVFAAWWPITVILQYANLSSYTWERSTSIAFMLSIGLYDHDHFYHDFGLALKQHCSSWDSSPSHFQSWFQLDSAINCEVMGVGVIFYLNKSKVQDLILLIYIFIMSYLDGKKAFSSLVIGKTSV